MNPNNQEIDQIELCLRKAIIVCKLRDILTRFGIPEEESVIVSLKKEEEVLASVELKPVARKNILKRGEMSLKDLQDSLRDDFINPAEILFGLLTQIPNSDQLFDSEQEISINIKGGGLELATPCDMSFLFSCIKIGGVIRC